MTNVTKNHDLAIIGAGSGGVIAAPFAARAGAKVALIEKHRIGGDCTWTGCVPSKALLKVAKVAHAARTAAQYGMDVSLEAVDMPRVMDYVRSAINTVYGSETPDELRRQGVDVHLGAASFADPHTLTIKPQDHASEYSITANNVIICTGGRADVPHVPGLRDVPFQTNETLFNIDTLPKHLLVMGGGPIGVEMTQAFRRLGSQVTLVEEEDRLLPKDEPEAGAVILRVLCDEGVEVHLNTRVTGAAMYQERIMLQTESESEAGEFSGDMLLIATGRKPNVEGLNLDKAGVQFDEKGISVDDNLRTNVKHVYAAGDVTGGPQFTHYAAFQAFTAARNALFPGADKGLVESVPWTMFTDPEVAHAGLTEAEAREKHNGNGNDDAIGVCTWPMNRVDRAVTENDTVGFIKVVRKKDGTILGATIVAERAGEAIHEWAHAVHRKWKLGEIGSVMHVYPTYSIGSQQLASAQVIESFLNSTAGKLINRLSGRESSRE